MNESEVSDGGACSSTLPCEQPEYLQWPAWTLAPGEVQVVNFDTLGFNTPAGYVMHNRATVSWDGMPAEIEVSKDVMVVNI